MANDLISSILLISLRIPAKLAICSGDVGHAPERSDAGCFYYSLRWPTSVNKNQRGIGQHHLLSPKKGSNLVEDLLSCVRFSLQGPSR
jgi:hypothetical protein